MKNKQHEYILKAFLESKIPTVMRRYCPELIYLDSIMAGYCTQLLKKAKFIELPTGGIISKEGKNTFSKLISQTIKRRAGMPTSTPVMAEATPPTTSAMTKSRILGSPAPARAFVTMAEA